MRETPWRRGFALLPLVMLFMVTPLVVGAVEPPPPARIAILDIDRILREAAAAKDIRRQIETSRKSYQVDIKKAEGRLRGEEESLKRQRSVLAPKAFAKRRRAFEKEVIALQRKVRDQTMALDKAYSGAMAELRKSLRELIAEMSNELGYNLVIDNRHIFIRLDAYDISAQVLKRLDKKVPKMRVAGPAK